MFKKGFFRLRKAKHILFNSYCLFKAKQKKLSPSAKESVRSALLRLQTEVMQKDPLQAEIAAGEVVRLSKLHLKKSTWQQARDFTFAILFALAIAIIVRQMWFEFYEIPSGSMRPTFKEKDRLVVSKTQFGINTPLEPSHLTFSSELVQRNGIVIFTGEDMDIRDVDTRYFYLFPGKKQYIKRLIGKPGDILYFYGGTLYGMDREGGDISYLLQPKELSSIEHIPFIHLEGKAITPSPPLHGVYSPVILSQMNEPIARLYMTGQSEVRGEMLSLSKARTPYTVANDYYELWGMENYASARLLTKEQVKSLTDHNLSLMPEGKLYLELRHHPSLLGAKLISDEMGRLRPSLAASSSLLPLDQRALDELANHLTTARFIVKNGFARRYGSEERQASHPAFALHLPQIPDGTYEFIDGKGYEVLWEGIVKPVAATHPLIKNMSQNFALLYNCGIEFDMRFAPQTRGQRLFPSRYGYFKEGSLYLSGAPIFKPVDPLLLRFIEQEKARAESGDYHPFLDQGPPLTAKGELDFQKIKQHGLLIPEKMYLVLGDNHAMSADSRDFGFVPQDNLRGTPLFIFWPPGSRIGAPLQPPYPCLTQPRLIIWASALVIGGLWYTYSRRRKRLPYAF